MLYITYLVCLFYNWNFAPLNPFPLFHLTPHLFPTSNCQFVLCIYKFASGLFVCLFFIWYLSFSI